MKINLREYVNLFSTKKQEIFQHSYINIYEHQPCHPICPTPRAFSLIRKSTSEWGRRTNGHETSSSSSLFLTNKLRKVIFPVDENMKTLPDLSKKKFSMSQGNRDSSSRQVVASGTFRRKR